MTDRGRLLGALLCALVMGGIAVLAAWVGAAQGYAVHGPPAATLHRLHQVAEALVIYDGEQGQLPDDLATIAAWERAQTKGAHQTYSGIRDGVALDGWGNAIRYAHGRDDFTLTSDGADGAPGGSGIATDLTLSARVDGYARPVRCEPEALMTFGEFLAGRRMGAMLIWCAMCAVVSGLLAFALTRPRKGGASVPKAVASWLVTATFTVFFTWIMALLEIVKYH